MRNVERIAFLISFILCSSLLCLAQDATTKYQGKVVSVIDGNTLTLLVDDKKLNVRLLGIDAPSQALRDASRENLSRLVNGKSVAFLSVPLEHVAGKQKFLVGKVLLNDIDVALSQITDGFVWQSNEFEKYQTPEDQQFYAEVEQRAKDAKRGIWSDSFKACKNASVKTGVGASDKPGSEKAKRPKVFGTAIVEVTIDESGNVISARALCGHPILQTEAVKAASQAKFSRKPNRITGNIVYNFVPD
jgi:micrococcal nuclease